MIQSFLSCCCPAKKPLDDTPQLDSFSTNYAPNHSSQPLSLKNGQPLDDIPQLDYLPTNPTCIPNHSSQPLLYSMRKKKVGISLKFGMIETIRKHQSFFPIKNPDDLQTKDIAELSAILSKMEDKLDESKRLYKPILHELESNRRD
ncbi:hypothetical protein CL657_03605 [bacterium]|nr:hypothetical protein [bacterium]|tara:strand:+ start:55 stop:492 length:438 start_codon:yes stop_codon:yes gene_type:complete